jgi:hypothetical protein
MNGKWLSLTLSIFLLCFFSGCPSTNSVYDTRSSQAGSDSESPQTDSVEDLGWLSYQNNSSHNISVQYFFNSNYHNEWFNYDRSKEGSVYGIIVDNLPIAAGYINKDFGLYFPIEKVLIFDSDNHKLLRKIEAHSFFGMLSKEKQAEEIHQQAIYDHFLITDDLLHD